MLMAYKVKFVTYCDSSLLALGTAMELRVSLKLVEDRASVESRRLLLFDIILTTRTSPNYGRIIP
jgi:hypothetical protein